MSIEAEKIELLKLILETDDEAVIEEIKSIFQRQEPDFWDELPDLVKESLNCGLADVEAGRVHKHEDVMREIKTHYDIKG